MVRAADTRRAPETALALGEVIRAYRKKGNYINGGSISEIVRLLDDAGEGICSHLEPGIFSILVQAFLQGEPCRDGEHGLQILAVS
jgi:hypothetical protein